MFSRFPQMSETFEREGVERVAPKLSWKWILKAASFAAQRRVEATEGDMRPVGGSLPIVAESVGGAGQTLCGLRFRYRALPQGDDARRERRPEDREIMVDDRTGHGFLGPGEVVERASNDQGDHEGNCVDDLGVESPKPSHDQESQSTVSGLDCPSDASGERE
uniref:Uncharacterized protein n=1 Tax=Noctiluca scintillans TaxID=2966 RepID=A0A7S1AWG9_NOCSC|mmetsp:Transcript_6244/g.17424  ORF Transcript_6244/g.17424 Transcript_6244/m.17424 type:complete len:163 (+) Transcript_6244:58-546(+)